MWKTSFNVKSSEVIPSDTGSATVLSGFLAKMKEIRYKTNVGK